jgi:glutamate--cysteine ligase
MCAYRIAEERLLEFMDGDPDVLARGSRIGIEKESLRVTAEGDIAQTPHPMALGSALTHRYITTDFSEALLEFITPPCADVADAMSCMDTIHRFTYANIDNELLWATSMPCKVAGDESVPIARYGSSNVGTMKNVYRRGLSYRYGRRMQAIAGVHFNYSLPTDLWLAYQEICAHKGSLQDFVSDSYFRLIRNFQRYGWLIPFLFGSSPAVCKSFVEKHGGDLEDLDGFSWYHPYATALRMSDIGYKNKSQSGLGISYDSVDRYIESLTRAIETPNPDYQTIGVIVDGEYRQLNANVLQIENEYYSFVRPKRVARSGEKPTVALRERGVEYVEVRALDVSSFDPLGVNVDQLRFLEAFLIYCLLEDSPPIDADEQGEIDHNQRIVVTRGREPGLELRKNGRAVALSAWAREIGSCMQDICRVLDGDDQARPYGRSLAHQCEAIRDPDRLPSARVLAEMEASGESFFQYAMRMSVAHQEHFRATALPEEQHRRFTQEASRSLAEQRDIEASDDISFETYLERYFSQSARAMDEVSQ